MVPKINNAKVQELLKKINSRYGPLYVPIKVEAFADPNECFPNVEKKISKDGGEIVYGWQIWKTNLICEAEYHAVWKSRKGKLNDITPKNIPVEHILFVQDDKLIYKGAQIDNIRINCTQNFLVDDFIDICKALFRIMNKGKRAYSYEIDDLTDQEYQVYNKLNILKAQLQIYIHQGGQINYACFCGSGYDYSECHRKIIEKLISKTF